MTPQAILDVLPQTQCQRCGEPDCAAYATAIAANQAPINRCPPGGAEGIRRLASITGQPVLPLDPAYGVEAPRAITVIDEAWCIGCTLCLPVCPTDAIIGGNKFMHTVMEAYCTGCALCVPVCPVDCIQMHEVSGTQTGWNAWSPNAATTARERYQVHSSRFNTSNDLKPIEAAKTKGNQHTAGAQDSDAAALKRSIVQAALDRVRNGPVKAENKDL